MNMLMIIGNLIRAPELLPPWYVYAAHAKRRKWGRAAPARPH